MAGTECYYQLESAMLFDIQFVSFFNFISAGLKSDFTLWFALSCIVEKSYQLVTLG